MGWEDAPIIQAAPKRESWEDAPIIQAAPKRVAKTTFEAFQAGLQGSSGGLAVRGKLPDIELDEANSAWYDRLARGVGGLVGDLPIGTLGFFGGSAIGGAAGTAVPVVGNAAGAVVGAGFGSMALPAAVRESYMQAYTKGEIINGGDFLNRVSIILKQSVKEGTVGAATFGAGRYVAAPISAALPAMSAVNQGIARTAITTGVEAGTATVSAAALEGQLPDLQDFADNAALILFMKGTAATPGAVKSVSNGLANIYRKTGKTPVEVAADIRANPTIADDLATVAQKVLQPEAAEPLPKGNPVDAITDAQVSHSNLPEAYRDMAARMSATEGMPTEKLKAIVNKPFADVPDVKLPEGLNLKYFENFDDMKAFDARIAEVMKNEINVQRGGTQKWAETVAKGEELLRTAAGQEAVNLLHREVGTADVAHTMYARGALMLKALSDAKEAADAYQRASSEQKPQLLASALEAANKAASLKSYYTGALAEAGRTLKFAQYYKDAKAQADTMARIFESFDGKNPDALIRDIANAGTLIEAQTLMDGIAKPDGFAKYMDYRRSGLMSGYLTIARNTFGGSLMLGKAVAVDAYSALTSRLTPGAETVPMTKAVGRLVGYSMALGTMWTEAARAFREGDTYFQGVKNIGSVAWEGSVNISGGVRPLAVSKEGGLIEKGVYYQAKTVFGANTLVDGLIRNFGYYGDMYARASTEAIKAGLSPNSKQFLDFVRERVRNPSESDIAAATRASAEAAFATDAGPILTKIHRTLGDWRYLKAIVPFVNVPGKMLEAGSRLSPFAPLVKSWRDDVAAGGERAAKAHAEAALGRIAWATTVNLALDGAITGYGPPEPEKRALWLESNQPYSIKLNGEWYNYGQTLQPFGPMLGLAADVIGLYEFMDAEEQDRISKAAFLTFKNFVGNATMLQGLADFFSVFTDEGSAMKFIRNFTASNLPAAGLLGNVGAATDPYQREVESMLDAVKARIPMVRETLNPKRSRVTGEPIPESDRLALGVIPAKSVPVNTDKIATEVARLGIGVAKLPDYIELPAGKDARLGKVELTQEEKDKWAKESGNWAYFLLDATVNSTEWDTLPDQVQRIIVKNSFEKAREISRKTLLSPERLETEFKRIGEGIERNFSQTKPLPQ